MLMIKKDASRRIAFPLAVLLHLMVFYALSRQGLHVTQNHDVRPPLTVMLLPFLAPLTPEAKPPSVLPHRESVATPAPNHVAKETRVPQPVTPPVVLPVTTEKPPEAEPPAAQSGASLAQSALNAIGKMDQAERGGAGRGLDLPAESTTLGSRLSAAIDKHGAFKAGAIEENVYPDGRREERIHSIFGDFCITYESPSDPKDGFDTMQRGLKPSVPHTCGHRFDK